MGLVAELPADRNLTVSPATLPIRAFSKYTDLFMPELYPLLLIPSFDERPWGVRDLRPVYTKVVKEPIGESWLTWEQERRRQWAAERPDVWENLRSNIAATWWDRSRPTKTVFRLLVKFLFTADKLSVQVHPDDEAARRVGEPFGKTECWYVLDAKPGAQVALGPEAGASRWKIFRQAISGSTGRRVVELDRGSAGDMLYVAAGTVHTIGGGLILLETQQASDVTYRLYDYGRPRELHIEEGLAAIKLHSSAGKVVRNLEDDPHFLVRSPFFQVERMGLNSELAARDDAGFAAYHRGSGRLRRTGIGRHGAGQLRARRRCRRSCLRATI